MSNPEGKNYPISMIVIFAIMAIGGALSIVIIGEKYEEFRINRTVEKILTSFVTVTNYVTITNRITEVDGNWEIAITNEMKLAKDDTIIFKFKSNKDKSK